MLGFIAAAAMAAGAQAQIHNALIEQDEESVRARVANGVTESDARAEMLASREARYERDRKLAEDMRRLTEQQDRPGIDPLYLAAAFAFGMAIG